MEANRALSLNNGRDIPVLGFGTYSLANDEETTKQAVLMALQMGYRHFDTAQIYGSEPALGKALKEAIEKGIVKREDTFVTSKLWCSHHHDPVAALKKTLKNLKMDYIDMYLVHWPVKLKPWTSYPIPKVEDFEDQLNMETTWAGMQKCLDLDLCKGIGVSNFSTTKIQRLLDFASTPPAVNQVEMHPMWRQSKLTEFCREQGIHVSAYSPLGGPGNLWGSTAVIDNPIIQSIALKHRSTPPQVALSWGLSNGASVIVKSFSEGRMKENMGALHVQLDDEDLLEIGKIVESKIMTGKFLVNDTTSPYKTIQDLWDTEI